MNMHVHNTHKYAQTCKHTHAHAHTHSHTHTRTHTHTHKHTHTHTHTHTRMRECTHTHIKRDYAFAHIHKYRKNLRRASHLKRNQETRPNSTQQHTLQHCGMSWCRHKRTHTHTCTVEWLPAGINLGLCCGSHCICSSGLFSHKSLFTYE